MEKIVSTNRADGSVLGELDATPPESIPSIFDHARVSQQYWSALPTRQRAAVLSHVCEAIVQHTDEIATLIAQETGKPRFEALSTEILSSANLTSYFAKHAPGLLATRKIPRTHSKHRRTTEHHRSLGIVVLLTPGGFPFYLPLREIFLALLAGNAIIFKPDAETPLCGQKIQELFDEAGLPPHLLQTVYGDESLSLVLIDQKPSKIFFTGNLESGRAVARRAAEYVIPVSLMVAGDSPLIVLADADLDYASSAAQGQGNAARMIVHESIAEKFRELLAGKRSQLKRDRPDTADCDLGTPPDPTLTIETFKSLVEAANKANAGRSTISTSIITRNFGLAEQLASHLNVGAVAINDVMFTAALPETQAASRTTLYDYVTTCHIDRPKSRLFVFKSPRWFPYSEYQNATFKTALQVFRRHWTDKLRAFPLLLVNFVQFIKKEKRL